MRAGTKGKVLESWRKRGGSLATHSVLGKQRFLLGLAKDLEPVWKSSTQHIMLL